MAEMGIGQLGFNNMIFKRKFRFTVEIYPNKGQSIPKWYVKVAGRPNYTAEETEINFRNAKRWIPGKVSMETLSITYIDVAYMDTQPLYDWLSNIYNFGEKIPQANFCQATKLADYGASVRIVGYDGCGTPLEQYNLYDVWPSAVNFGDLDYASSEEATIEVTLRYSQFQYVGLCPQITPQPVETTCP
jgi:hypothetical protein